LAPAKLDDQYAQLGVSVEATTGRFRQLTRALSLADLVLSPSRSLIEIVRACGLTRPEIEYSDNGVPMALLSSYQRTASPNLRFGYYSALVPHKGIEMLLQAFGQVADKSIRLVVRGQGNSPYVEQLVRAAASDDRIRFGDAYDDRELAGALSDIDVLIVPSLWYENSPLLIHEATAVGIPTIAADIGGMAEFVKSGENGLLFRCGDAADLRRVLERFASDRGLVHRLRKRPFPVKSIEENAAELRARYSHLVKAKLAQA
jgi:glycosyltransferase involved in cell wall biosynthesis